MKSTIILGILCLLFMNGYAKDQKASVPESIKKIFISQYPGVTKVEWEVQKNGNFEAEYKGNNQEVSVLYDTSGNVLETKTEINQADLPQAIKALLTKEFAAYKLEDIEKKEINGEKTFCMEAEMGEKEIKLVFDENGNILKTKTELKQAELPQSISSVLAKDFAGYKMENIIKVDIKGAISYSMEAEMGKKEFKLAFDESGKILKEEEEKEN